MEAARAPYFAREDLEDLLSGDEVGSVSLANGVSHRDVLESLGHHVVDQLLVLHQGVDDGLLDDLFFN